MMADRFIDQLNELTDPATGDWLVIEDVSAGETKKINPGTATFRDVQTSPADTTAGRVLTVGAFGLGSVSSGGDPDTLFGQTSIGRISVSIESAGLHDVINLARLSDRNFQLAGATAGAEASAFIRTQGGGGVVTPWRELYHTGNTIVDGDGFIKEA